MDYLKIKRKIGESIEKNPFDTESYNDLFDLCRDYEKDGFTKAHAWNHELRGKVLSALQSAAGQEKFGVAEELNTLLFRSLLFGAPHFFDDYLQAVEWGKPLDKKFYLPRRHYLKRYVDAYQEILDGKLDFLSISMPKRAIAADCPVLTVDGFKRHGDLKKGDYVFGESGKPVKILAVHPDEPMTYRITFSNGESIVTTGEHEWKVFDKAHNRFALVSTADMETLDYRQRYSVSFVPILNISTVLTGKEIPVTALFHRVSVRKIERLSPEEQVTGNCITVEGGLYRVGNTQILTHNCGKSQLGINFTNMLSGKYPDRSTLMEGTGDDLVKSFYLGCLEYLQVPSDYHFYDIFPESRLVQTNADTKIINLQHKSRFPTVMCRSIDARQVGLSEATNLLYLDDCVEGREEAKNRQRLDDKWEIISGDIIGRAIEGTPIVICGTRYSLYDPIGHLQEEMTKQGKRCKIIETPALDPETDESNFEYVREGKKVFTTQYFRDQREMLSAEQFESEFQQQPFEAKGILFPETSLNTYFELPVDRDPDTVMAVCDTADSGADYCAMPIAYVYGSEVYIEDVVFDDSVPEVTKPECAKALIEHKVASAMFESNNAGTYFARDVQQILTDRNFMCSIRTKRTISNKQTRIEFASDNIIKHFYFKHPSRYARNSQYAGFMKQVTTYTRSGKVPHDDAPDSLAMLENELRGLIGGRVEIFDRRI